MDHSFLLPITAAISISLTAISPSAAQQHDANLSSCVHMEGQVQTALTAHAQSTGHEAAVKEERYGREFCAQGLYAAGIAHYGQALKALGASKT